MSTLKIKRENGKIFCPLADSWHIETPEEKVRQEYIKILVENYGYSLDQMAQEIKVNNSQRGQGKARADIVIWKSKQDKIESKAAFIVVECKAENVRIREEDYYQGYNYASWAGASFFVTTNEKETKYFNVDKDYLPKELVEVVAIPTAEEALNDKKVKDILSKTKTFTRDDFTKILRTCHNIIRNNDKLSPEAAFDEISKILFMKIKYEREQRGAKVFTKNEFVEKEKWFEKEIRPSLKGTPKDLPYMQFLFYNTKEEFKADQLFEENEIIKIRQNSFEQILEKLETYNLSDTQDDVKGIAFEQFLGTTFRGELGQYFTPRTIVDFMTHILDPKENETVCDPTCGSGGFLIKAFEYMREKIEEDVKKAKSELRSVIEGENYDSLSEKEQVVINERIEAMQSTLNKELDTQVEGSRMYNLSRNCIYGTDAIKTKKQYYVKAGQLAVSKIDARNGAFGIVPPEADGAIITGNFWVYDVNPEIANIDYLILLLSSNVFVQAWQDCSNGSGNRLYLQEEKFLNYKIPMPEADVQKDLIRKYNTQLAEAKKDQDSIDNLQYQIEQYILKKLGISFKRSSFNGLIGTTYYKNLTRWDPTYLSNKIIINSNEKMIDMAAVIAHFMVDTSGKRLRINTKEDPDKKFAYIGMEHVEKNTGKVFMQQISGKDILSQTVRVPYDYIIYGKLRPYLNKYWENRSATKNVVCSSEFFVFDTKNINRIYFMEILSSTIIQEQLTPLYSGARMPRINESDFMGLKIPLPSPQKQQEIVDYISEVRRKIATLQLQIPLHSQRAKKEFEEAVFGEAQKRIY